MAHLISFILFSIPLSSLSSPLSQPFSSCLEQHSDSLASSDQLITFDQLWTQLESGPASDPIQGSHNTLRFTLAGSVPTQSLGYSSRTNFLATLITQSSVLNFQTFFNQSALCSSIRTPTYVPSTNISSLSDQPTNSSLALNSGCPYGPGSIALGFSVPLSSPYPLTTISTQLHILDTSTPALTLACVQVDATPYYPYEYYHQIFLWVPFAIAFTYLVVSWTARIWAANVAEQLDREAQVATSISDPYISTQDDSVPRLAVVWWHSWGGQGLLVSGALLRFSTPGVFDVVWHTQFFCCLGLFAVQWPDFLYPIVTKGAWSTLVFNTSLVSSHQSSTSSVLVNPLSPTAYAPPVTFTSQFDDPLSPLYLNRTLPNTLLNLASESPGIPRWAKMVGLQPRDVFSTCVTLFALICGVVIFSSVFCYLVDLCASISSHMIRRGRMHHTSNQDSGGYTGSEIDDGVGYPRRHGQLTSKEQDAYNEGGPAQAPWWQMNAGLSFRATRYKPGQLSPRSKAAIVRTSFSTSQRPVWRLHWALLQGNLTRTLLLFYFPVVAFSTYHLTLFRTASTSSVIIAGICLCLCVLVPSLQLYRIKKRAPEELIDDLSTVLSLGPMYNTFADRSEMFIAVRFCSAFAVGAGIGASQSKAIVHAVILLIAEMTETMLTSLWLPWGDGAAMAPLAFVFSVSRIITAVILVVLTPTVSLGSIAVGWLTYVILLLQGIVFLLLLCVLLVKMAELALRLFAHIPFDESRSTRYGGLQGAVRRWDRGGTRSTRHSRAAAIAARRRRRRGSRQIPSSRSRTSALRTSSKLNPDSHHQSSLLGSSLSTPSAAVRTDHRGPGMLASTHPSGLMEINDEDGNIMSAMSQGPWLRTQPFDNSHPGFITPGAYSNQPPTKFPRSPLSDHSDLMTTPSSGFAVVRGGRATEQMPYQLHDNGRRTRQDPRPGPPLGGRDYPPSAHQARHPMNTSHGFTSSRNRLTLANTNDTFYQLDGAPQNASRTTTNLFENTTFHPPTIESRPNRTHKTSSQKRPRPKGPSWLFGKGQNNRTPVADASSDDYDTDDDTDDDEDRGEGSGRQGGLKGVLSGSLARWWSPKPARSSCEEDLNELNQEGFSTEAKTFEVVRQPRPRPSPAASSTGHVQGHLGASPNSISNLPPVTAD